VKRVKSCGRWLSVVQCAYLLYRPDISNISQRVEAQGSKLFGVGVGV